MHSKLFAQPDEWSDSPEQALVAFRRYAEVLELDAAEHARCVAEGDFEADVRRNVDEARSLGLGGTPMFIINGKLLSGAHPTDTFIRILDGELDSLGAR
jgi:protein-disulfide isomerase